MLSRAYWKGSLKLSLVTCPVALYPATTTVEKTRFHSGACGGVDGCIKVPLRCSVRRGLVKNI